MKIVSVRKNPEYTDIAIKYFQEKWATENSLNVYEDCINHSIHTEFYLPQWYLLMKDEEIVGCAGLITNDFISRMDLFPWVCALYIEEKHRGHSYGNLLLEEAKKDAKLAGFSNLYLNTDHIGYYEHFGFEYLAMGYHPWGGESRIYKTSLK